MSRQAEVASNKTSLQSLHPPWGEESRQRLGLPRSSQSTQTEVTAVAYLALLSLKDWQKSPSPLPVLFGTLSR